MGRLVSTTSCSIRPHDVLASQRELEYWHECTRLPGSSTVHWYVLGSLLVGRWPIEICRLFACGRPLRLQLLLRCQATTPSSPRALSPRSTTSSSLNLFGESMSDFHSSFLNLNASPFPSYGTCNLPIRVTSRSLSCFTGLFLLAEFRLFNVMLPVRSVCRVDHFSVDRASKESLPWSLFSLASTALKLKFS